MKSNITRMNKKIFSFIFLSVPLLLFTEIFAFSSDSNLLIVNDSDCIVSDYRILDTDSDSIYLKNMFTTVYGNAYQLEFGIISKGNVKVYITDIDSNVICKIIDSEFGKGKYIFELAHLLFQHYKFSTGEFKIQFFYFPENNTNQIIRKDTAFFLFKKKYDPNSE